MHSQVQESSSSPFLLALEHTLSLAMDKENEYVYPTRCPRGKIIPRRYLRYSMDQDENSQPKEPGSFIYSPLPTDSGQELSDDMHRVLQAIKNDLEGSTMTKSVIGYKPEFYSRTHRLLNQFVILTLAFHAACKKLRIATLARTEEPTEMMELGKDIKISAPN